ncbi:hypothetical protein NDU88_004616 [Pleurodeles waltl]|uniref:Uncharacterized protein n=1 Tax=Pleurodeles waltl TaxID=8319 RepID=A0AAV7TRV8_PLEWA|nr:hypothetical protein NDU88_004616 [Pleurodeles waltl]
MRHVDYGRVGLFAPKRRRSPHSQSLPLVPITPVWLSIAPVTLSSTETTRARAANHREAPPPTAHLDRPLRQTNATTLSGRAPQPRLRRRCAPEYCSRQALGTQRPLRDHGTGHNAGDAMLSTTPQTAGRGLRKQTPLVTNLLHRATRWCVL